MHHFVTEMCTILFQNGALCDIGWCIVVFLWKVCGENYIAITSRGRNGVSNHRQLFVQQLVQTHIKGNIKVLHDWPFEWESCVTTGFPSQIASSAESVPISKCHHICSWPPKKPNWGFVYLVFCVTWKLCNGPPSPLHILHLHTL